ncbi:RNA-directed DNA polymerase from mobile element jockey-like, partial [Brachionus plicatilis]
MLKKKKMESPFDGGYVATLSKNSRSMTNNNLHLKGTGDLGIQGEPLLLEEPFTLGGILTLGEALQLEEALPIEEAINLPKNFYCSKVANSSYVNLNNSVGETDQINNISSTQIESYQCSNNRAIDLNVSNKYQTNFQIYRSSYDQSLIDFSALTNNIKSRASGTSSRLKHKRVKEVTISGILVCGDFNLPNIRWDENYVGFTSVADTQAPESKLIEKLKDCFFVQNVSLPTFVTSNGTSNNVLDYIITESTTRINAVKSSPPLGNVKQGHVVFEWVYQLSNCDTENRYVSNCFNFRKADFSVINKELSKIDWGFILKEQNCNKAYESFVNKINEISNKFVPKRSIKDGRRMKPRWLNNE